MSSLLLILNAGSSSLKFAVFDAAHDGPRARLSGQVEGIGTHPHLVLRDAYPSAEALLAAEGMAEGMAVTLEQLAQVLAEGVV